MTDERRLIPPFTDEDFVPYAVLQKESRAKPRPTREQILEWVARARKELDNIERNGTG